MRTFLTTARHSRWRWLLVPTLLAAAAAHLPVIPEHLAEAPYMGALFITLSAGCVILAATLISFDSTLVYALAITTCALAITGYLATRMVAFPMLADDVGNWTEPLGVVSISVEFVALLAAATAVRGTARPARLAA
ncbi:MAG TPA: hypothetical protein VFH38_07725 [Jatrophihabitans sp.]|nr:hypothetical protein [Jatrophihabitans sp.]